jgi:hypothetical protein
VLYFQLLFTPSHKYSLNFNPLFSPSWTPGSQKSAAGELIKGSKHLKDFHPSAPCSLQAWMEEELAQRIMSGSKLKPSGHPAITYRKTAQLLRKTGKALRNLAGTLAPAPGTLPVLRPPPPPPTPPRPPPPGKGVGG